jgi:hypothetical protein
MLQRFHENCWRPLAAFPLKILDNVSSSGSDAGITASSQRGRTPKGTKVSNLYEYFKYIFLTVLGIFGSPSYFTNVNTKQAEMWDSCILSAATTVNSLTSTVCKVIMTQVLMSFRDT